MINLNIFKGSEGKQIYETYNDPFKSDKITKIFIWIQPSWSNNTKVDFKADVEFKNGNTKGSHNIEADDLASLLLKIENFIKGLSK